MKRNGTRYFYFGVRELAAKHRLSEPLDRTDAELYNELASKQLIDNKEKYKKSISELVKGIQDKIKEEELLLDSLRTMSPYIIMQENVHGQIDSLKEEMKDVIFVIEHIKALEKKYISNFLESLRFSRGDEEPFTSNFWITKNIGHVSITQTSPSMTSSRSTLYVCGVDETRAKAIVKKHLT